MKKLILALLVIGLLGGGYYLTARYLRLNLVVFQGEIKEATRGDLVVPITASGFIKPASITQIKSKASGEVRVLPLKLGAMVQRGAMIIKLLDVDEKRNVERAQADFDQAQIAEDQARLNLKKAEGPGVSLAKAKLESAKMRQVKAHADFAFRKQLLIETDKVTVPNDWTELAKQTPWPGQSIPREEWIAVGTAKMDADAAVLAAQAELDQANLAIQDAQQAIRTATERKKGLDAVLNDSKERLKETTIFAPIDGMILSQEVQIGEVVASAKVSLTGGNLLMEIADVSEIYAVVNVDEADIGQVRELAPPSARPGTASTQPTSQPTTQLATLPEGTFEQDQPVTVKVEAFSDEEFKGVITQISPQSEVSQAVATFKVWIRIIGKNKQKLEGLLNTQAEAHFTAKSVRNAVLVPYDAVQKNPNAEGDGVYIPVTKPGALVPQPVFVPCTFGADNGIVVEVRKGIREGQKVYTKLPQKRDDGK